MRYSFTEKKSSEIAPHLDEATFLKVSSLCSGINSQIIRPRGFFMAWHGIPALLLEGWPPALLELKQNLDSNIEHIRAENSGSRFPKISLGALNPGAQISPAELEQLFNVCADFSEQLNDGGWVMEIRELSVVEFECRSLEKLLFWERFSGPLPATQATPPLEQVSLVEKIMSEFSRGNLADYINHVNAPGNDLNSYRGPLREAVLVSFLDTVPDILPAFRGELDRICPGKFSWFETPSLHVTVRSLDSVAGGWRELRQD